jgi:hypothetical protein
MRRHIRPAHKFLELRLAVLLAPLALMAACATDGAYVGGDAGVAHFNQIGRAPVAAKRPGAPYVVTQAVSAQAVGGPGVSVDEARRRVEAYLAQAGFEPEISKAAGLYTVSGERMASAKGDSAERPDAVCPLKALERPQMYTTHIDVRLSPAAPAGVQMGVEVKVVELDANLLSGAFSKQVCQSRGVLEAALRRAAFGG